MSFNHTSKTDELQLTIIRFSYGRETDEDYLLYTKEELSLEVLPRRNTIINRLKLNRVKLLKQKQD